MGTSTDQVLMDIDALVDGATKCTGLATRLLEIFKDLDNFSKNTLLDPAKPKLTDGAKVGYEILWVNWATCLLGMANYLQDLGVTLSNAAVLAMNTDLNIALAFGADPAKEQSIRAKIDKIEEQTKQFDQDFNKAVEDTKAVNDQAKEDAKYLPETYGDRRVGPDAGGGFAGSYESKKYPGSYYTLDKYNRQHWIGLAHQHEQYLPVREDLEKKDKEAHDKWFQEANEFSPYVPQY